MNEFLVKIEIQGDAANIDEIRGKLSSEESGFRLAKEYRDYNLHQNLNSELGDVATIAGVVLSASQLALSLIEFRRKTADGAVKEKSGEKKEINVITPDARVTVMAENEEELKQALSGHESNGSN